MSKLNLSAVSVVAALPAAALAYLLVVVIVWTPGFDKLPGFLQIFVVLSLLAAALLALMPIGIFLFVGRSKKSDAGRAATAGAAGGAAAGAAGAVAADEFTTEEDVDEELAADEFGDEFESDEEADDFGSAEAADEFEESDSTEEGDLFGSDEGFDTFELGGDEDDER